jgi:hypothetical protein
VSTSEGRPYSIFKRALQRRNLPTAEAAARELARLSLADALELTILIARKEPRRHPRVAARWLMRYLEDCEEATIDEAAMVAAASPRSRGTVTGTLPALRALPKEGPVQRGLAIKLRLKRVTTAPPRSRWRLDAKGETGRDGGATNPPCAERRPIYRLSGPGRGRARRCLHTGLHEPCGPDLGHPGAGAVPASARVTRPLASAEAERHPLAKLRSGILGAWAMARLLRGVWRGSSECLRRRKAPLPM